MFVLKLVGNNLVLGVDSGIVATAVAIGESAQYGLITMQGSTKTLMTIVTNGVFVCRITNAKL